MKTCVDCMWFKRRFLMKANLGRCLFPDNMRINPVDGTAEPQIKFAENMRDIGPCGSEGKFWMEKK